MEEKIETYQSMNFPKKERLHSRKMIDALFLKGASFHLYPFSVRFLDAPEPVTNHQFMTSVSKRKFKKAVDRNRIKRLVKEAYRLNKHLMPFSSTKEGCLLIAYIYTAKEIHKFSFIESKLIESVKRLKSKLNKKKS